MRNTAWFGSRMIRQSLLTGSPPAALLVGLLSLAAPALASNENFPPTIAVFGTCSDDAPCIELEPGYANVLDFRSAACRCQGGARDGQPCTPRGTGPLGCADPCEDDPATCATPCRLALHDEFVGRLILSADDAACSEGGGSKLTIGLSLRRADGEVFSVSARTVDLCNVDPACNEPEQSFLCALREGVGHDINDEKPLRASETLFNEFGFGATKGQGGSFEAMPILAVLADALVDDGGPFPGFVGMPILSRAVPIAAGAHAEDEQPTSHVWCVLGGWLDRSLFNSVVPAPMAAAFSAAAAAEMQVDGIGACAEVLAPAVDSSAAIPARRAPLHDPAVRGVPSSCSDGSACTEDARFDDGACLNVPVLCDDDDDCTTDSCDSASGCVFSPFPLDRCDDDEPCTADVCFQGECLYFPADCDDLDPCTEDNCSLGDGCAHAPFPAEGCDDGDPCTSDSCDGSGGCSHFPKCDDLDFCTIDGCTSQEQDCQCNFVPDTENPDCSLPPTTLEPPPDCSKPVGSGLEPTATDCLYILRTAVGLESCEPECICAPTGSLPVKASDALLCLRRAVGVGVVLNCPCD